MIFKLKSPWFKMVKDVDLKELADVDQLRQLLRHINQGNNQYILKDNGQPQAALLSLEDLELIKEAKSNKEKAWQDLFENLKAVHALNLDVSEEQVHADVAEAIRAVRQSRN